MADEKKKLGCGVGGENGKGCICYLPDATTLGREGNCLRFPPQISLTPIPTDRGTQMASAASFPRVSREWFCFEWREPPKAN